MEERVEMNCPKSCVITFLFAVSLTLFSGCTPEKAQALRNAAITFKTVATVALSDVDTILKGNIEMPPQDVNEIAIDLDTSNFTSDQLQELLSEGQLGNEEAKDTDKEIANIQATYDKFSMIFNALPKGSYFASGDVDKAKKYAVNLTVQMVNLANMLEQNKIQVKLNARRIMLVEQIKKHNTITNTKLKQQFLQDDAKQVLILENDEARVKDAAVAQCLKAAEAGWTVTQLIKNYKALSLSDILTMGQDSLNLASQISNQNANVLSVLKKYNGVVTSLQNDPYWKSLLGVKINPSSEISR